MVRQDEEDRAVAFRASLRQRAAAERARVRSLTGDAGAAEQIRRDWEPVILARIEAAGEHAPEDCDDE